MRSGLYVVRLFVPVFGTLLALAVAEDNASPALVEEALKEGFEIGARQSESAALTIEKARRAAPQDPRVPYAAGLIWFKQLQPRLAAIEFGKATKMAGDPYWPAWQAWAWCAFRDKDLETGLERLESLVNVAVSQPEVTDECRAAVAWSGSVIAALERVESSDESQMALAESEKRIRKVLRKELPLAFEEGKVSIEDVEAELEDEARDEAETEADRARKAADAEKEKLDEKLDKAAQQKDAVKRSAEEWKKWLNGETARIDKQLASLEKDYNFLVRRKTSLEQSIFLIGREITALHNGRNSNGPAAAQNRLEIEIQGRQVQLTGYQNDHTATLLQMVKVAQDGTGLVAQKQRAVQQYELATGKLAQKHAKADKWSERLAAQKTQLKPKTTKKPVVPKSAITFLSLVPFDVETERERLLEELQQK